MNDCALEASERLATLAGDGPVGVALSGGGDSTALMLFVADWAQAQGREVFAATVDHGFRPDSGAEAAAAGACAKSLGARHEILKWTGWSGRGNLSAAARDARYALLADWARRTGCGAVALGHTRDDVAETFLMRLARGSGVDGLAAMPDEMTRCGVRFIRPLLGVRRDALRDFLRSRNVGWVDDPTNDDPRFDRVRARRMLADPVIEGLSVDRLADTADRMASARRALSAAMAQMAARVRLVGPLGDVRLSPAFLKEGMGEIPLRLLSDSLRIVSGADYPPDLAPLKSIVGKAMDGAMGAGMTLHGCILRPHRGGLRIVREPAAVAPPTEFSNDVLWDNRWRSGGVFEKAKIGAVGPEGVRILNSHIRSGDLSPPGEWTGAPAQLRHTCPAIWSENRLLAVPHAGFGPETRLNFTPNLV